MKSITNFKRGDTMLLSATYKVDGVATDVTNIDIASQIRTSGNALVATMAVTKLNQTTKTGQFTLSPTVADTTNWPLGVLCCDIQFSQEGSVRSTETFQIVTVREVTK